MEQETGLIHFDRTRQELQKAQTFDEVFAIRESAERLRRRLKFIYASLNRRNEAAEIKLRAERRLGEMLREAAEKGHRKTDGRPKNPRTQNFTDARVFPPTLAEIGINKDQASRWRSIAAIPEEIFEQTIQKMKQAYQELTQSALLRVAQKIKRERKELDNE